MIEQYVDTWETKRYINPLCVCYFKVVLRDDLGTHKKNDFVDLLMFDFDEETIIVSKDGIKQILKMACFGPNTSVIAMCNRNGKATLSINVGLPETEELKTLFLQLADMLQELVCLQQKQNTDSSLLGQDSLSDG